MTANKCHPLRRALFVLTTQRLLIAYIKNAYFDTTWTTEAYPVLLC